MNVADLPAVKEAVASGGVFAEAVRKEEGASLAGAGRVVIQLGVAFMGGWLFAGIGLLIGQTSGHSEPFGYIVWGFLLGAVIAGSLAKRVLHPNVQLAKKILKTGTIPLDKIGPALQAREPSDRERREVENATRKLTSPDKLFFDGWFVLPSSHPYALTFGSYLFLSRGAIEKGDLDMVLAHELGHLNHGDSFVKCALWALGKGWTREYMSVTGKMAEDDADKHVQVAGLGTIGSAIMRRYWEVAIAEAALMSILATGSSLRGMEEDLRAYFGQWDIEADGFAETLVSASSYQRYLKDLADFELGVGTMPLHAPAELRYDKSIVRLSMP